MSRYYLHFTTEWIHPANPTGQSREIERVVGPFSSPESARDCWRAVYADGGRNSGAWVSYKEFDL